MLGYMWLQGVLLGYRCWAPRIPFSRKNGRKHGMKHPKTVSSLCPNNAHPLGAYGHNHRAPECSILSVFNIEQADQFADPPKACKNINDLSCRCNVCNLGSTFSRL